MNPSSAHFQAAVPALVIVVNGQDVTCDGSCSIATLLARRDLTGKRVAVERNGAIVPRSRHAQTLVEHGDRIEIVVAVGGG